MASVKVASLLIKTISKPIANSLKKQALEHDSFKRLCIKLAQTMHTSEAKLRTGFLNEPKSTIRPLIEAKAITNGATALAEGFLFFVGLSLIAGEAYRSSRSAGKRRDDVDDRLDELKEGLEEMKKMVKSLQEKEDEIKEDGSAKTAHLESIISQIIQIGLRGGWIDPSTNTNPLPLPTTAYISANDVPPPFPSDDSSSASTSSSPSPSPSPSPPSSPRPSPSRKLSTAESIQPFVALQSQFDKIPQSRKSSTTDSVKVNVEDVWTEEMIDGRVHLDSDTSEKMED